jgi:hypothetical protein
MTGSVLSVIGLFGSRWCADRCKQLSFELTRLASLSSFTLLSRPCEFCTASSGGRPENLGTVDYVCKADHYFLFGSTFDAVLAMPWHGKVVELLQR